MYFVTTTDKSDTCACAVHTYCYMITNSYQHYYNFVAYQCNILLLSVISPRRFKCNLLFQANQRGVCPHICPGCKHFDPADCKASISSVKDGCGCCDICPRQQGDLCDEMYLCDERRGLYCDTSQQHATGAGICRGMYSKLHSI